MFEINATMAIFILSFLLFIVLLDNWFLTPVGEAIESRMAKISGDNKAAQDNRDEAKAVVEKYEKNLTEIREKAQKIINESMAEAQKERTEKLAAVDKDGREKFDQAKMALVGERKLLIKGLVDEETKLVSDIVSRLLGSSATVNLGAQEVQTALEEAS